MAEIFPDEGLDLIINTFFKQGTPPANLYVGLFTSATPTTVPLRTATGGASPVGFTEMVASSGAYARQAIAAASWGAPATDGSGRATTGPQVDFTGFVSAANANSYFIATASAPGASNKILCFANFNSGLARGLAATTDHIQVTPTAVFNG